MSSGAKVVAAFIRETTPGITPTAGAWNLLRRSSFGLKPTQNTNDNDEIAGDRMAQGVSRGTVDVGGDVGTRFRWNQHDDFLASCFGAEWQNNVLTMGNGRITFSVATFASDVGIAQIARGCQVGTFQMEIPSDGDITATITFAGLDWETKGDDTSYFTTPVDLAGALRYSFKEVTNIRLNGVDGGTGFSSTPLTFSSTTICRPSAASVPVRHSLAQTFRQPLPRQVKSRCHGQRLPGRFTKKRSPAKRCRLASRWRMLKAHIPSISRKCRSQATGRMRGALTLFRFSWISPRPILRQLSPAFPKCRRRQSVLRQPLQLEQWDLL